MSNDHSRPTADGLRPVRRDRGGPDSTAVYRLLRSIPVWSCGGSSSCGASRPSASSSTGSAHATRSATRAGGRFLRRLHPGQLRPDRSRAGIGRLAAELGGDRDPGDDHPDRHRRVRRLRVRVDRLQGPQAAVHRHRVAARDPAPGGPDPGTAAVQRRGAPDPAVPRQDDHAVPRLRPRGHARRRCG